MKHGLLSTTVSSRRAQLSPPSRARKLERPYRLSELFCGCGGFSHGFALSGRFSVELGSELNETFCETFRRNHHTASGKEPVVLPGDLTILSRKDLPLAFKDLGYYSNGRLDVLLGGPPCEGFSQNKRSEQLDPETGERNYGGYNKYLNDPRNFLVRHFLRVVEDLTPKVVVIENVPQILTHDHGRFGLQISARLRGLGYLVKREVMFAPEYGVPQLRRRAFFLGVREDLVKKVGWVPDFPPPQTHYRIDDEIPPFAALTKPVTVRDAIADLPESTEAEEGGRPVGNYPANGSLSDYAIRLRSKTQTPFNHIHRTVRVSALQRLKAMKPGMRLEHLPEHLRTKSWYFNCYGRLDWDYQARTITKSCNYVGSGCFGHPTHDRGITMREAARLQSFDDDFRFWSDSEHQVSHMIGGAVPPLLARAIAESIISFLDRVNEK
jgi:DNA (cytosine-5)-methyltransferase 1